MSVLKRLRSLRDRIAGSTPAASSGDEVGLAGDEPPRYERHAAGPARQAPPRTSPRCYPGDLAAVREAITPRGRPLVVNHWATWCPPCVEELPRLVEAAGRLAGEADVIGVSWDAFENPAPPERLAAEVAAFAGEQGLTYPSVVFTGTPDDLFSGLGLSWRFIPQTFVLDGTGKMVRHFQGELSAADVEALVVSIRG